MVIGKEKMMIGKELFWACHRSRTPSRGDDEVGYGAWQVGLLPELPPRAQLHA